MKTTLLFLAAVLVFLINSIGISARAIVITAIVAIALVVGQLRGGRKRPVKNTGVWRYYEHSDGRRSVDGPFR